MTSRTRAGLSIRLRITAWYTALVALYLGLISVGGYVFLAASSLGELDELLAKSASTVATAMEFERHGGASDSVAIQSVIRGLQLPDVAILVLDLMSREAVPANRHPQRPVAVPEVMRRELDDSLDQVVRRAPQRPDVHTAALEGPDVRIFTLPYVLGKRPVTIGVAQVMSDRDQMLSDARNGLMVALPLLLALAAGGGWWLAGKSLAPVAAMTARAQEIGARNLHERLPVRNPGDELGRLAMVLNDLIGRMQDAFDVQSRFVAEASHELRTPVAVIVGESELALAKADRPAEELRDALRVIKDESGRLRTAIEDLFLLTRADAGERLARSEPVALAEILESAVRRAQPRAGGRTVSLVRGDDGTVLGDGELLRRVVDNLIDNAIKYSARGAPVTVSCMREGADWAIDVTDAGPGVPEAARPRLFERFYRADDARARTDAGGAGLGLAIARSVARAHGGDVTLHASAPDRCVFRLTLPAA